MRTSDHLPVFPAPASGRVRAWGAPHPGKEWLEQVLERVSVKSVTAILYQCAPDWAMPARRIGDDMLFYILKGRGHAVVAGRTYPLRAGACLSFRRGVEHAAFHDPRYPINVISVHYTASVFDSLPLPELVGFPDLFMIRSDSELDALLREACREYELRPLGWERGLESLALRILLRLIRKHGETLRTASRNMSLADLHRLFPALNAMQENLGAPAPVPAVARAAGLSEAQFRRVFARVVGMTPIQYLSRLRMERACWLLQRTSQTLEAIARQVGYADAAAFAHSFKRLIRVAPGAYRRKHEL